jgi:hypothetical protein
MILLRKWVSYAGGSIHMDLSYTGIPIPQVEKVRLYMELNMLHHVEDPCIGDND